MGRVNNRGKKIFLIICLILIVMVSVTSITYAYFALYADDDSIVGITGDVGLDLDVEKVFPLNGNNVLVPQLEDPLARAISTEYSCVDENGNNVCNVYKATVTNTGTASVKLDGTIAFTGIENMPNLKWKRIKDERIIGGYLSHNATTTDTYFERFELFEPSETKTYYFVIWIDEVDGDQTDSGTFRATIKFNYTYGAGLTSTAVPMSYMTGFSAKDDYSYYRSDTYREKIKNVYFVDYIDTTGSVQSWDMTDTSMSEAGAVIAWVKTNTSDNNYYDLYIGSELLIGGLDFSWLFYGLSNVEGIYFNNFDTRETTNMFVMFSNCYNLINLDVSNFDTSNVTNMAGMFQNCNSLIILDVSGFDTSKVTTMQNMFKGCNNVFNLDVFGFDTSNVTNMRAMFDNCRILKSIDVSNFETSSATELSYMFNNCNNLKEIDVSSFDTSNVINMSSMFDDCHSLLYLDVSGWDTSKVTDMSYMFNGCFKLTQLDISGFNTSKVTNMTFMFFDSTSLTYLDVSDWDTSNVTAMSGMFGSNNETSNAGTMNLENLDVSNWNTSKVTDMSGMFQNCVKLTTIDVSKWNTSSVTTMQAMFAGEEGYVMNLTTLNLNSWNTSSVTNMHAMFMNCPSLSTTISIKNSGVTDYEKMFLNSATKSGASITVNYTSATSSLVDSMVATKSENSNVEKGSLVS